MNQKVKLYVMYDEYGKVFAMSESKILMQYFVLQTGLADTTIEKITSEKKFNKLMVKYSDDLLLEEVEGFAMRRKEVKYFESSVNDFTLQIYSALLILNRIVDDCDMSLKEHNILEKAISVLEEGLKDKNINNFINSTALIREMYNSNDLLNIINEEVEISNIWETWDE